MASMGDSAPILVATRLIPAWVNASRPSACRCSAASCSVAVHPPPALLLRELLRPLVVLTILPRLYAWARCGSPARPLSGSRGLSDAHLYACDRSRPGL